MMLPGRHIMSLFFPGQKKITCDALTEDILLFSTPETHPYENVLSHCDVSARRMWTLYRLCDAREPFIVVTSIRALLQKTLPPDVLIDSCRTVSTCEEIDREGLSKVLVEGGYTRVSLVEG